MYDRFVSDGEDSQTTGCSFANGTYELKWSVENNDTEIVFDLTERIPLEHWTGVGFGDSMVSVLVALL